MIFVTILIIFTALVNPLTSEYSKKKPPVSDFPVHLNELSLLSDDAWLEIDDMFIMNKYLRSGLSDVSFRWDDGIVPYVFRNGDFTSEQQQLIESIMTHISTFTCIVFVNNENQTWDNYLLIRNERGFSAAVGNTRTGGQWLCLQTDNATLGQTHPGYLYSGVVAHELLHSLGFEHEHQRDDRDSYINIHYENIDNNSVRRNFLRGSDLGISQDNFSVPYNYESLMQYPKSAFSNNGKDTMTPVANLIAGIPYPLYGSTDNNGIPKLGQTSFLSKGDILMIQNMYAGICPGTVKNPPGGPVTSQETVNAVIPFPKVSAKHMAPKKTTSTEKPETMQTETQTDTLPPTVTTMSPTLSSTTNRVNNSLGLVSSIRPLGGGRK